MNNDAFPRGLFFLAGAASGFALGIYLHSEKGSALREQLNGHWEELLETLGERAHEQMSTLMTKLNDALEKGLLVADDLEDQMELNLGAMQEEAREVLEDAETSFESGMEKARDRLQQKFAAAGISREG